MHNIRTFERGVEFVKVFELKHTLYLLLRNAVEVLAANARMIVKEMLSLLEISGSVKTPPNAHKSVGTHPNASKRIRTHPNTSERGGTGPSKSENFEKLAKTSKSLQKPQKISQKNRESLVFVAVIVEMSLTAPL